MLHRDCRKRPSFVDIWEVFLKNNCTKDFFKMVRYHESFDSIGQRKNAQVFVNKPNDAVLQRNQSNYILNGNYTTQPVNSSIYRSYQLPYFHTNSTRKNTARRDMKKEVITVHTDINGNKTYSSRIMTREYNHQDNNFPSSHNQQMKQTVRNNKNSRPIIIKERVIQPQHVNSNSNYYNSTQYFPTTANQFRPKTSNTGQRIVRQKGPKTECMKTGQTTN